MPVLEFKSEKSEKIDVVIDGKKYTLPGELDVSETAAMMKLFSVSTVLEDDTADPDAYNDLAEALTKVKGLFYIHNSKAKADRLRLTTDFALEIFNEVYSKNE